VALKEPRAGSGGLLLSLRRVGASIAAIVHSRVELVALELEREKSRIARLVVLGVIALFFLALGAITATIFVIVLFWDSQRLVAIGFLTVLYFGIGAGVLSFLRKEAAQTKRPFSATVDELRKDRDRLNRP
jgi:uncharacterized membrane protein YqjE